MDRKTNMSGTIIVGAGRGLAFAKMLNGHLKKLNCKVLALVDINKTVHPKVRQRLDSYGACDTLVMSSLSEALKKFGPEEADSVMVVASNKAHAELTLQALAAKRHVFLEKPIAANLEDALAIASAVANSDRVVQLGFVLRYSSYYRKIREVAASGKLGRIVMLQINERLDLDHSSTYRRAWRRKQANTGGFMNEKCSHDMDIFCWIKQGQAVPVEVFSCGGMELFPPKPEAPEKCADCLDETCPFRRNLEEMSKSEFDHSPDLNMQATCTFKTDADVLNHQSVIIRFSDGAQAIFTITAYSGDPDRDIIIHGTEGYLAGKLNEGSFYVDDYRSRKREVFSSGILNDQHGGGDDGVLSEFFGCIENGAKPTATVADGLLSSQLAFAADMSVQKGRKISLSELNYPYEVSQFQK
jgi:predicted dehydrogenase